MLLLTIRTPNSQSINHLKIQIRNFIFGFEFGSFDIENAVAVEEWDDFSVYSKDHMQILAQLVRMCTLKRDYVNIGYYAEKFAGVGV